MITKKEKTYKWLKTAIQKPKSNKTAIQLSRHTTTPAPCNFFKGTNKLIKMRNNISKLINKNPNDKKRTSLTNFQVHEKRNQINKNMMKKTYSKMKKERENDSSKYEQQNLQKLKEHINDCIKIHNNFIRPSQPYQQTKQNNQRRKFLKNQISFTEIDQQQVKLQRKILEKNHNLDQSIAHLTSIYNKPTRTAVNNESLDLCKYRNTLMQCFKAIDTCFDVIQELSKIAYNRRRNKYVIDYCKNCKEWLKEVFLQESKDDRENYTLNTRYIVVENAEIAKEKLAAMVIKSKNLKMRDIIQDIQGLLEHIEILLAQKKIIEIGSVGEFIEGKIKEKRELIYDNKLRFSTIKQENLNLTVDLEEIQSRFGQMKIISKVSRRKFQQLNKSYERLMTYA